MYTFTYVFHCQIGKCEAVVYADTLHIDPAANAVSLDEQIRELPATSSTPLPHNSE